MKITVKEPCFNDTTDLWILEIPYLKTLRLKYAFRMSLLRILLQASPKWQLQTPRHFLPPLYIASRFQCWGHRRRTRTKLERLSCHACCLLKWRPQFYRTSSVHRVPKPMYSLLHYNPLLHRDWTRRRTICAVSPNNSYFFFRSSLLLSDVYYLPWQPNLANRPFVNFIKKRVEFAGLLLWGDRCRLIAEWLCDSVGVG